MYTRAILSTFGTTMEYMGGVQYIGALSRVYSGVLSILEGYHDAVWVLS